MDNFLEKQYAINVFNLEKMEKYLDKKMLEKYIDSVDKGEKLEIDVADQIATAMKTWAMEKGVTHYAHWFKPLTGSTAEKHDAFIELTFEGNMITDLLGSELIKGEPDASSFPSGGLRATFEARGYTSWDITSPAFIKRNVLYIPTVFCSYTGEVLDQKTPLLRSEEVLSSYAIKILRIFGNNDVYKIIENVGAEQEYFLVDKKLYEARKDLFFTGRTLFGNAPARGQSVDAHYFTNIEDRVQKFMSELDLELWSLGIPAKTEHNEVAPAQHELAPLYTEVNIASDNNQLIMELMQKTALKNDMVCLLHEKPFEYINGSGKHNNWSLSTDDGINLFKLRKNHDDNIIPLLFIAALIRSVDKYGELLKAAVMTAGNERRLGGCEAPPSIISIFLGEELTSMFEAIELGTSKDKKNQVEVNVGVKRVPKFLKDSEDRNRTSPFAFTGNKFEFRMLGSSMELSTLNTILNTIYIDSLDFILKQLEDTSNPKKDAIDIIRNIYSKHKKIVFNGDGYSKEWLKEAQKRALSICNTAPAAYNAFENIEYIEIFEKYNILTKGEFRSKINVIRNEYVSTLITEAKVMQEMVVKEILPSTIEYAKSLASSINDIEKADVKIDLSMQKLNLKNLMENVNQLTKLVGEFRNYILNYDCSKLDESAVEVLKEYMKKTRKIADLLEEVVSKDYWAYPTYEDLLYRK